MTNPDYLRIKGKTPPINVYLTPDDKERLAIEANEAGLSLSAYVRQILIDAGYVKGDYQQHGTSGKGRRKKSRK